MLFPKGADLSKLKAAVDAAIKAKWGDKPPKGLRSPFRDQGEKDYAGYEPGAIFVTAKSKERPGLVDAMMNDIIEETGFYSGCYARAQINPYAYDTNGNKGVAFGLNHLQKLRDGEPMNGRTRVEDAFEAVPDAAGAQSGAGSVFE
jgi:hypothetical protein